MTALDDALAAFWRDADDAEPERMRAELGGILAALPAGDAGALFERASLHDFLGEEDAAIPLYRAALSAGLDAQSAGSATIQLASSLRNVGDASGAISLLKGFPHGDLHGDAARAFLSLALLDDGKPAAALREALHTLAPHLPAYGQAISGYADELAAPPRIRAIAVGVLIRDGWMLAEEYAGHGDGPFLRAPGGGIEFGERADAAVRREFGEELGVSLDQARPIGVLESIFDAHGKHGHEIVYAYEIRSAQLEALPLSGRLPVLDSDTSVGWYRLDTLAARGLPLYPHGILDLLTT